MTSEDPVPMMDEENQEHQRDAAATNHSDLVEKPPVLDTSPSPSLSTPPSPFASDPVSSSDPPSTTEGEVMTITDKPTVSPEAESTSSTERETPESTPTPSSADLVVVPALACPSSTAPPLSTSNLSPATPTNVTPPLLSPSAYIQPLLTSNTSLLRSLTTLLTHYHTALEHFDRRRIQPWLISAERYLDRQVAREDELTSKEEEMRREVEDFVNKMKGWQEVLQQSRGGGGEGRVRGRTGAEAVNARGSMSW